jgi:hypothetical protein
MGIYKKALEDFISEKGENDIFNIVKSLLKEDSIQLARYSIGRKHFILIRSKPSKDDKTPWMTKKGYAPDNLHIWCEGFGWTEEALFEQISRQVEHQRKQQNESAST